jgi:hypothetical protein
MSESLTRPYGPPLLCSAVTGIGFIFFSPLALVGNELKSLDRLM